MTSASFYFALWALAGLGYWPVPVCVDGVWVLVLLEADGDVHHVFRLTPGQMP